MPKPSTSNPQGRAANHNGRAAENVIVDVLTRRSISYLRQHPIGLGIFGTPILVDFYLPLLEGAPGGLIIESKWQQISGSVDEKLVYLTENIVACYPCATMIVVDGAGFRPGAVDWVRAQVGRGPLRAVLGIADFLAWSNRAMDRAFVRQSSIWDAL